ncbi:DsbA family protein [Marinobacter zhejiangensis]|uniref:Protein-disulfide isomerase n=1 Tax=Marinobacter zhejiangensis TaxID=488535 RepID=A0A1I4SU53_9GAMM|nr:DsbA family protein [Marinobacter zhejiangensis]SFM67909.1 Protein-disulfide isomerase [Marinobacter zhejiangensis]
MGEAKRRNETGKPADRKTGGGKTGVIVAVVLLVVALVAGVFWVTQPPEPEAESLPVAAANAEPFPAELDRFGVSIGDADAPVVVREFADFQCPACGRFAEASAQLKDEYVSSGKVRFVFFDLPLGQHQNAMPAAMAARCAGDQEGYWAMHDRIFANQTEWSNSSVASEIFARYARELGLEERRFSRCMESELHREVIENSVEVAKRIRVTSTPTVLVDSVKLSRPGWGQLSAVVERELGTRSE